MLQEIETPLVSVTDSALEAVRSILTEKNLTGYALRVYVAGSGCHGTQFNMALDNNIHENDLTYENNGIKVVIDNSSIEYLRGAKIDFVDDPVRGAGFLIDSPNANQGGGSCSCNSGGHSHEASDEAGCTCGGSCSCEN
jgi:iron-sulfur cluster assembly accessory protein